MKEKLVLFCGLFLLVGCTENESKDGANSSSVALMETSSIQYSSAASNEENDTITVVWNEVENSKRLDAFLLNFNSGNPDRVTIIVTTIEGDPIIQTMVFDGKKIELEIDSSADNYGSTGENRIEVLSFDRLVFADNEYKLTNESDEDDYILVHLGSRE